MKLSSYCRINAAGHGTAGVISPSPTATGLCSVSAPAQTFRAHPRNRRFYRKGAVALLGRQMALWPQLSCLFFGGQTQPAEAGAWRVGRAWDAGA